MDSMDMTDSDILKSYQEAKDQKAQVTILADLNCVSVEAMAAKLKELGLPVDLPKNAHPPRPPVFDAASALRLYEDGESDVEIAEQLGVRVETFARWRRAQGLPARYPKKRKPAAKTPKTNPKKPPAVTNAVTAARMAEIFAQIAKWHPGAVVRINGSDTVRRISLVSEYGPDGEPVMEIRLEHREGRQNAE